MSAERHALDAALEYAARADANAAELDRRLECEQNQNRELRRQLEKIRHAAAPKDRSCNAEAECNEATGPQIHELMPNFLNRTGCPKCGYRGDA